MPPGRLEFATKPAKVIKTRDYESCKITGGIKLTIPDLGTMNPAIM